MTKLFGIPVDTLLAILAIALAGALGIVAVLALRHPVLVKLGVRNVGRRRGRTALIVVGLMLGFGYVLAAVSPFALGAIRDGTGSFTAALWAIAAAGAVLLVACLPLSRERLGRGVVVGHVA